MPSLELEAAGVVVQPGQQPPNRNTRLSLVARNALRPLRGDANAAEIEKQVEAGKLSLADLDAIGEKKDSGVLSLIFGTSNAQEAALSFVASSRFDAEIEKKSATGELSDLLRSTVEIDLPDNIPLPEIRDRLARHVLLTDLVVGLGDSLPVSLSSLKVAASPGCTRCLQGIGSELAAASGRTGQLRHRRPHGRTRVFPGADRVPPRHDRRGRDVPVPGAGSPPTCRGCPSGRCDSRPARPGHLPPVPLLVGGHPHHPGALGAACRRRRGAAGSGSGRQGIEGRPQDRRWACPRLCRGRIPLVPARHSPSAPGEPLVQLRPRCQRPASRSRKADPEGGAAVHRGRLSVGEVVREAVLEGEAPDPRLAPSGPGLRDAGEAPSRQRQDRLRLGRCPSVRDGQGTGRCPQGRTST